MFKQIERDCVVNKEDQISVFSIFNYVAHETLTQKGIFMRIA